MKMQGILVLCLFVECFALSQRLGCSSRVDSHWRNVQTLEPSPQEKKHVVRPNPLIFLHTCYHTMQLYDKVVFEIFSQTAHS